MFNEQQIAEMIDSLGKEYDKKLVLESDPEPAATPAATPAGVQTRGKSGGKAGTSKSSEPQKKAQEPDSK